MTDFERRKAIDIDCPLDKAALEVQKQRDLKFHDGLVRYILLKELGRAAGRTMCDDFGQKIFGLTIYNRVVVDKKMPCLRDLVRVSAKLDQQVIVKLFPYKNSCAGGVRVFHFGDRLDETTFLGFLFSLNKCRGTICDSKTMEGIRIDKLRKLQAARPKLDWIILVEYAIACGYQLNIYINPQGGRNAHEQNPSDHPQDGVRYHSEKWWADKEQTEEYQAVVRRLDYPA